MSTSPAPDTHPARPAHTLDEVANLQLAVATLTAQLSAERARLLDEITAHHANLATARLELEQLRDAANKDVLTGLPNRRALYADDHGSMYKLTLIDLDGLKAVNDTQGHEAGDTYIRHQATEIMLAATLAKGTAYRIGGDEFVIVSDMHPDLSKVKGSHGTVPVFTNQGMRDRHEVLDEGLRKADTLMYVSKRARRTPRGAAPVPGTGTDHGAEG